MSTRLLSRFLFLNPYRLQHETVTLFKKKKNFFCINEEIFDTMGLVAVDL